MKKAVIGIMAVFALSMLLVGCGHTHEWIEATCQEAKHCVACGETEGEPIEHSWNEANCTEAKTCAVCKEIGGDPLGHAIKDWAVTKESSCALEGERVGVCERCAKECKESVEKLAHTPGDWQVKEDYIFNPDGTVKAGTEAKVCMVCGEEIETREYTVELTLSQKNAVICAYDDIGFWHCGPSFLINFCLVENEDFPVADAKFAVEHIDIDWDEQAVIFARENSDGASKSGLTKEMRYYGFNNDQIEKALKEIGY